MEREQQNRLDMFNAVDGYMKANVALWQGADAVKEAVEDLEASIEVIDKLSGKQGAHTTGITDDKEQARTAYEDMVHELAGQIGAFAAKQENVALAAQVDITRTGLDKLTNDDLLKVGDRVAGLIHDNLTALAGYMVTQQSLEDLAALRTRFAGVKSAPRLAIAGRASLTDTLPVALNTTTRLLDQRLDRLMIPFRRTQPEFFAGYEKVRVIVNHGHAAKATPVMPTAP